jgi:hypothetical protein
MGLSAGGSQQLAAVEYQAGELAARERPPQGMSEREFRQRQLSPTNM